jgi:lipoprotein-anchoring transpeptidase ErfK/SrfK
VAHHQGIYRQLKICAVFCSGFLAATSRQFFLVCAMKLSLRILLLCLALLCSTAWSAVHASTKTGSKKSRQAAPAVKVAKDGVAEAHLIEIYRLIGKSDTREALTKAEQLVKDYPNFQLAHLVYGDLLSSRMRAIKSFGDVPASQLSNNDNALQELRFESALRLKAQHERPPAGSVPSEFLLLSPRSKHAIAVDASRGRLYLFENHPQGLSLVADYYISVGKAGIEKKAEGDLRTPLGIYFITSLLDPSTLKDYYGSGALPINYPNVLDIKRGKTGSGIWLHGTPRAQFSRPPLSSDGCVVMANPDLEHIIKTVEIRSTPVVIAQKLKWVTPQVAKTESAQFETHLNAWLKAKSIGNMADITPFYASDFNNNGKSLTDWLPTLQREVGKSKGNAIDIKDLSLLHWKDNAETMIVTFGEVLAGQKTGLTKRQYWTHQGKQWKIFYEGNI